MQYESSELPDKDGLYHVWKVTAETVESVATTQSRVLARIEAKRLNAETAPVL